MHFVRDSSSAPFMLFRNFCLKLTAKSLRSQRTHHSNELTVSLLMMCNFHCFDFVSKPFNAHANNERLSLQLSMKL